MLFDIFFLGLRRRAEKSILLAPGKKTGMNKMGPTKMELRMKLLEGEWSPRNSTALSDYDPGSNSVVWWEHFCQICQRRHEWEAPIIQRLKGINCPHCFGRNSRKRICFCRSLAAARPDLASEWSPENKAAPEWFTPLSQRVVLWEHFCGCGRRHRWKDSIYRRCRGLKCPKCVGNGGRLICPCKSVADLRPDLGLEWHPKNFTAPSMHDVNSKVRVWWECLNEGHEWMASIRGRTSKRRRNCPACKEMSPSEGILKILNRGDVEGLLQSINSNRPSEAEEFEFRLP